MCASPTVLFCAFHQHWAIAKPPNVMSFQPLHDDFLRGIKKEMALGDFSNTHDWMRKNFK